MATVQAAIIDPAFRLLGVQSTAASYSTYVTNAATMLSELIEAWNMRDLRVPRITTVVKSITSGTNSLTETDITGTGFRPNMILAVSAWPGAQTGTLAYPLRQATLAEWQTWPTTAPHVSGMPEAWWFDAESQTTCNLYVYPVPTQTTSVNITYREMLDDTVVAGDTVAWPKGYTRALKYNLALDLSPEFGGAVVQADMDRIERIARESLRWIEQMNVPPAGRVRLDPALSSRARGGPSIYAGAQR